MAGMASSIRTFGGLRWLGPVVGAGLCHGFQEAIIERLGKTLHGRLDDITHEPLPAALGRLNPPS